MGLFETLSKWIPVVGPIVSTASDIVGGIAANKANKEIADQTNATQMAIAGQTNAANKELWQMQAEYNSMVAQRQRAEQAGYSPNSILQSSGFNSSVSAPAPAVMPQMQMSHQMINPFANVGGLFNGLKSMAEIQNIEEQTKQQKMQNQFTKERIMLELKAAGLDNVAKKIQNEISAKTENDIVSMAHATLEKLYADKTLSDEQMLSYKIANAIAQEYGYQLSERELAIKTESVKNLIAQRENTVSSTELNKALGKKARTGALLDIINGEVAQEQKGLTHEQTRLTKVDADFEEQLQEIVGGSKSAKLILELIKALR